MMQVVNLRCEFLANPLGIDVPAPRLSWQLNDARRGACQRAYRIQCAATAAALAQDHADIWDSGRVASGQSHLVPYAGPPLQSGQRVCWRVRVWDQDGQPSAWSEAAWWSMALLAPEDWAPAAWIGLDRPDPSSPADEFRWLPARYLRREFTVNGDLARATVTFCGLGVCDLHLNGARVAEDQVLNPAQTDFEKRALYQTVEVTEHLLRGMPFVEAAPPPLLGPPARGGGAASTELPARGGAPRGEVEDGGLRVEEAETQSRTQSRTLSASTEIAPLPPSRGGGAASTEPPSRGGGAASTTGTPCCIGAVLGNARFHALRPGGHHDFGFPKLILRLDLEYADGRRDVIVSDGAWRITDQGPMRANHEYDGEVYDARREMPGWDAAGFDDRAWEPARLVAAPGGRLESSLLEPTRRTAALAPVAMRRHASGVWLADFGEATYGQPQLRVRAPAGTEIRLVGAYSLRPDGRLKTEDNRGARCTDVYICRGGGEEVWSPRFRGQGCRWLEVTGWPGELTADDLRLLVVRHDAEPAGTFACSDPLLTRISANVGRGVRAFLRQGLPMEPDRDERQPWLGDPACSARSYAAHLQVAPFLRKWLADIRMAQREDGSIPAIAPKYWTFGAETDAVWPAVIAILPEWLYRHYGDRQAVVENYPAACRWVTSLERGLGRDGTTDAAVYGDWCDAASMDERGSDHGATSRPLIASAYLCHSARLLARMAGVLGRDAEAAAWSAKAAAWTAAFNRRFFDAGAATYQSGTQCALLLPLAFGLVPAGFGERVLDNLVRDILETHRGHTTVGLIGNQWLLPALSARGRADVAYTIATRTERPSWGYMVAKGATTIWERWDSDTRGPGMNSEALLIQAGSLGAWFVETLAGIVAHPDGPGFTRVLFDPYLAPGLAWARAEVATPYGPVRSHWRRDGDRWHWEIALPPNTTGAARFPCDAAAVSEGGGPAAAAPGVRATACGDSRCLLELEAGAYHFTVPQVALADVEGAALWVIVHAGSGKRRRVTTETQAPTAGCVGRVGAAKPGRGG